MGRFLLEARDLRYARGGTQILAGVTVGLHAGEFGVLLGPSGSGKSSLLRCMAGIVRPDRGEVLLDGRPLSERDGVSLARAVGMVPQDDIIHTQLRLRDALEYAARLRFPAGTSEQEIQSAVDRVLSAIELEHRARTRIKKLSGGQRKRASMGIELLCAPRVLFLDEPTSGLDPDLESTTMKLLRKLADEGRGVLTTTHSTASVELADFLLVVVAGHLAYGGPPQGALEHFGVSDHDLIFKALRKGEPTAWARRYAQSPRARSFAQRGPRALRAAGGRAG